MTLSYAGKTEIDAKLEILSDFHTGRNYSDGASIQRALDSVKFLKNSKDIKSIPYLIVVYKDSNLNSNALHEACADALSSLGKKALTGAGYGISTLIEELRCNRSSYGHNDESVIKAILKNAGFANYNYAVNAVFHGRGASWAEGLNEPALKHIKIRKLDAAEAAANSASVFAFGKKFSDLSDNEKAFFYEGQQYARQRIEHAGLSSTGGASQIKLYNELCGIYSALGYANGNLICRKILPEGTTGDAEIRARDAISKFLAAEGTLNPEISSLRIWINGITMKLSDTKKILPGLENMLKEISGMKVSAPLPSADARGIRLTEMKPIGLVDVPAEENEFEGYDITPRAFGKGGLVSTDSPELRLQKENISKMNDFFTSGKFTREEILAIPLSAYDFLLNNPGFREGVFGTYDTSAKDRLSALNAAYNEVVGIGKPEWIMAAIQSSERQGPPVKTNHYSGQRRIFAGDYSEADIGVTEHERPKISLPAQDAFERANSQKKIGLLLGYAQGNGDFTALSAQERVTFLNMLSQIQTVDGKKQAQDLLSFYSYAKYKHEDEDAPIGIVTKGEKGTYSLFVAANDKEFVQAIPKGANASELQVKLNQILDEKNPGLTDTESVGKGKAKIKFTALEILSAIAKQRAGMISADEEARLAPIRAAEAAVLAEDTKRQAVEQTVKRVLELSKTIEDPKKRRAQVNAAIGITKGLTGIDTASLDQEKAKEVANALLSAMESKEILDDRVRQEVGVGLLSLQGLKLDESQITRLVKFLGHEDENMRIIAACALAAAGEPAIQPLFAVLKGKNENARDAAIGAIINMGDQSLPSIIENLKNGKNSPDIRATCAWLLGELYSNFEIPEAGYKDISNALAAALGYKNEDILYEAKRASMLVEAIHGSSQYIEGMRVARLSGKGDGQSAPVNPAPAEKAPAAIVGKVTEERKTVEPVQPGADETSTVIPAEASDAAATIIGAFSADPAVKNADGLKAALAGKGATEAVIAKTGRTPQEYYEGLFTMYDLAPDTLSKVAVLNAAIEGLTQK